MKLIFVPLFIAVALLFIGLAIPLIRRRVKPNKTFGLRVPATFADEWVWYEANARSGRDLFRLAVVFTGLSVLLAVVPGISVPVYTISSGAFILCGTIWFSLVGWLRANRLL